MYKTKRSFTICVCGLLIFTNAIVSPSFATPGQFDPSISAENPADKTAVTLPAEVLAQRLIKASGLEALLVQIPSAIESGFAVNSASNELEEYPGITSAQLTEQLTYAFSQQRMAKTVGNSLLENLTTEQMTTALRFLESPLGHRIVEQEVERSSASQSIDVSIYGSKISASPFRQKRHQVLSELESAWQLTEANVDMLIDMQIAMSVAMMPWMPNDTQTDATTISNSIHSGRPELIEHYKQDTMNTLYYVYAKLTLEELKDYIAFATSVDGQKYVNAMNVAHRKAMMEGSFLWGQVLGRALADERKLAF